MKLEYLKEFLALAQIGNYTAAAEDIYLSESTLSRHMMALEKELRTTLFQRGGKKITLTEAGMLLMPYARRVVAALDEYDGALEEARLARRRLTVGFGHAVQEYGLAEQIFRFRRENPDIEMLMTEDKSESLWRLAQSGECDFVFCYVYDFFDAGGLRVLPLLTDTLAVVMPETHPLAGRERISLQLLKEEHFIMQSRNSTMCKFCFQLMREAGCDPKKTTFAGSVSMDMVSHGMGIALMDAKRNRPQAPSNVRFVELDPPVEKELALVYRDRVLSPQAQSFLSFVQENML